MQDIKNFGGNVSEKDNRTIKETRSFINKTLSLFATNYEAGQPFKNIYSQDNVGICTSASLITGLWEQTGTRYSEDFQYYLQKKYTDKNKTEGSSAFSAIKTAYKYGLLKKEIADKYFIRDEKENYQTYIKRLFDKFEAIESELLLQAEKVITAYSIFDEFDVLAIKKGIDEGALIIARYVCGNTWFNKIVNGIWKSCWRDGNDIEPIATPKNTPDFPVSGHLVCISHIRKDGVYIANTFGKEWTGDGHGNIDYIPTELWKVYTKKTEIEKEILPVKKSEFKFNFTKNLSFNPFKYVYDVEMLQYYLIFNNYLEFIPAKERGYFGRKTLNAVIKFQKGNKLPMTGFVGNMTRQVLNALQKV